MVRLAMWTSSLSEWNVTELPFPGSMVRFLRNGWNAPKIIRDAWLVQTTNVRLAIVEQLHCKETYVYAMGQEPWLNYVMSIKYTDKSNPIIQSNRLIETCRTRGITAERLFGEKEILLP